MDVATRSEPDVSSIVFVFITSTLFFYAPRVKAAVSTRAAKLVPEKPRRPEIAALSKEIEENEVELNKISPTSEFAAYFKKERQVNKLKDELAELIQKHPQETNTKELMKMELVVRLLFNFTGFLLLYLVAGIHAFCMESWIFWPVNHMLRFPSVFSAGDVCGGSDSGLIPVSYFVLFYVLTAVVDRFSTRFVK